MAHYPEASFLSDPSTPRRSLKSRSLFIPPPIERLRPSLTADMEKGLSGNSVRELREDREGNLWVATEGGIDSFRDLKVR